MLSHEEAFAPYVPLTVSSWLAAEPDLAHRQVDGTLVFADVSGFTPLSERLARKGKVGAEQLTDILNELFGELLDIAADRGGDLLKFGGDALLLLFDGEQHAARAAVAADRMQDALSRLARVDTGSGIVTLRMAIGVHSGPVDLFLVGDTHRELIVTGPTATRTCAMESIAGGGEILLSPETAARIDPSWLGREKDPGRLLKRKRTADVLPPQRVVRIAGAPAALAVPDSLREHLEADPRWGEHRQATIAFLRFSGVERVLADEGPESLAKALDELVCTTQNACERHDVCFLSTDIDTDGGKILLSAGAPRSAGHDEDRMLHVTRTILDANTRLDVRLGVNRGHAFAVGVGGESRRCFSVMGDVVNLAARVMGNAPQRGVLATRDVTERLREDFDLEAIPPFFVKGKSEAVDASLVLGARGGRRADDTSAPILVGRDTERSALSTAWSSAERGTGSVVLLVGDPGLGKSRLISHARESVGAAPQFVVEGTQYGFMSPYFALRAPLRSLLGAAAAGSEEHTKIALRERVHALAPTLEPWLPLIGIPFGAQLPSTPETRRLEEQFRRPQMHAAVTELLERMLPGSTLLVVEDAHWLDDASSELLEHLLAGVQERHWLACVTRRDVPGGLYSEPDDTVQVLKLAPLAPDETAAMVAAAADETPLPPDVLATVIERSGGNPLFLQELIAAARAGGAADTLPDTVEALISARIDTLSAADRSLLRYGAVLGGRFPMWLLQAVMADADRVNARTAIGRELGAFLSVEGGIVRFRHALMRDVAYEALPYRRRQALHRHAGEALEESAVPGTVTAYDLLSLHFFEAQVFEKAWTYSVEAAERARADAGLVEATVLYQRAVASARRLTTVAPAELVDVCESLGDVAEKSGQYDVAAGAYRAARQLCRDDRMRTVRLCGKEGWLRERSGSFTQALQWYSRGQRQLGAPGDDQEARRSYAHLVVSYGAARLRQGRYADSVRYLEQAVGEALAVDDLPTLAHAYYLLDWAHTDMGHGHIGGYRDKALTIYSQLSDFTGQANTLNNLGVGAYYEGRWREALDFYERSRHARQIAGDVVQIGEASNNSGEILSDQGHLDSAATLFRDALRLWRGAKFPIGSGIATSNLGRVAMRHGELDEAGRLFAQAREVLTRIGAKRLVLETDAREAERLVALMASESALALVEQIEDQERKLGGVPVLKAMLDRLAGYAYLQLGELTAASNRLHASLDGARVAAASFELALSLMALARLYSETGADPASESEEAHVILRQLGVVAVTNYPLRTHGGIPAAPRTPVRPDESASR